MGTFLGRQANAFMRNMGFEYIWLSNGFGFSFEPWRREGIIYDGEKFHINNLKPTKENLLNFWKLFRNECRDFDVEARGTNYSVGVDYACDGVPLYDIYKENPDICAAEMIPHLLKAEKNAPDEPSPIILVYPFREYTTSNSEETLEEMYCGDLFLRDAVNSGFPIATVVSTDNFIQHPTELYNKSILLVPALTGNKDADKENGTYLYGHNISGTVSLCMPKKS